MLYNTVFWDIMVYDLIYKYMNFQITLLPAASGQKMREYYISRLCCACKNNILISIKTTRFEVLLMVSMKFRVFRGVSHVFF